MDITRVTEDLERVGYLYIGYILHMSSVQQCTGQYYTAGMGGTLTVQRAYNTLNMLDTAYEMMCWTKYF